MNTNKINIEDAILLVFMAIGLLVIVGLFTIPTNNPGDELLDGTVVENVVAEPTADRDYGVLINTNNNTITVTSSIAGDGNGNIILVDEPVLEVFTNATLEEVYAKYHYQYGNGTARMYTSYITDVVEYVDGNNREYVAMRGEQECIAMWSSIGNVTVTNIEVKSWPGVDKAAIHHRAPGKDYALAGNSDSDVCSTMLIYYCHTTDHTYVAFVDGQVQ